MYKLGLLAAVLALAVVVFLGARALTISEFEQANQYAVLTSVAATRTTQRELLMRRPPMLRAPADGAAFDNAAEVKLEWDWYRPLAENEFFDVRVWREGEPANGITWTREGRLNLRDWILYQQPGDFFWSVAVVQQGADGQGTQITDAAQPQHFAMRKIDLNLMALPPGFVAHYYARLPISQPTVTTFGPDGAMYVLSVDGDIARLTDEDGDGFAETSSLVFSDTADRVLHAVGLAFHEGILYLSDAGRISKLTDSDGDGILDTITPLVEGLPTWQHPFHSNNGIAFGPDGKLYVGVGSTTDHGPIRERYEASILRMNPDGSDLEVFATGFRNPYDLVFTPEGDLFTADNSPDHLDETLTYLPPEELIHVRQGRNYGFPDEYGFPRPGSSSAPPVVEFFTSSASSGITYYGAEGFPPEYRGIYVAQFGTGADTPMSLNVRNGRQVVFVALTPDGAGSYAGTWKPFAVFMSEYGEYSPIDVTAGPDGALYITEWITAAVFRVTYEGDGVPTEARDSRLVVGEAIYRRGAGDAPACIGCHVLSDAPGAVAPSLLRLGEVAGSRVAGLSAEEYVRQSITDPNAYLAPGYNPGLMYQEYGKKLTPEQIDALVAYVLSLARR